MEARPLRCGSETSRRLQRSSGLDPALGFGQARSAANDESNGSS